jgi:tellurite methyltransferase
MPGVPRSIVGFTQDEEGSWVANLACGHRQHVRHNPPWQLRPWVLTEDGRNEHLGVQLDCVKCGMPELPPDAERYKVLGPFNEGTIPGGLLKAHSLKPGVWGRIVVTEGRLQYVIERAPEVAFVLEPGAVGIALPEEAHHIAAMGEVVFTVEFWRRS